MADDAVETGRVEPWLRGPLEGVHPLIAPTVRAYMQALEDVTRWTDGLSDVQIWSRPQDLAPVGFQLRHIAGSVERLTTYLRGEQLTPGQLEAVSREMEPGQGRTALLQLVADSLGDSERVIRALPPEILTETRKVGRKQIQVTVAGLVVHLAEHTQRHVGELIITTKLARTV
jgi:DinB superfamily